MVEFVFVHGVATRPGAGYDTMVVNRDALLKAVLFAGNPVTITSPMWGNHASNLVWGGAVFQHGGDDIGSLSLGLGMAGGIGMNTADFSGEGDGAMLAAVATASPAAAIDELFATLVATANAEGRALDADELEQFQAAAQLLAEDGVVSATEEMAEGAFVDALREDMGVAGSYGALGDTLKAAARRVTGMGRNVIGQGLVALFRDQLNPAVAMFLGDIFAYLKPSPMREAIRATVIHDLAAAHQRAKDQKSKLILMGHSLGGVILYDLLSSPQSVGLPPGFKVDAFITVGSQPGLFEELTLFDHVAAERGKPHHVAGPANVGLWLNIFDPIDLFGFKASPVFAQARDFEFDSGTGLASAHTTYFSRPQFHAKLRQRLIDERLLVV